MEAGRDYSEPSSEIVTQLAKDLQALNPRIVRVKSQNRSYLVADSFVTVQSQIDVALDKKDYVIYGIGLSHGTGYCINVRQSRNEVQICFDKVS